MDLRSLPASRCTVPLPAALKTAQEFDKALAKPNRIQATGAAKTATEGKKESAGAYRHLLTGDVYAADGGGGRPVCALLRL